LTSITFGTDGWRAIIGTDFTMNNVKVVAQAIADYMKENELDSRGIIVGYDTRKRSRDFAEATCRVMLGNKILTCITERDTPTPVTALEVYARAVTAIIAGDLSSTAAWVTADRFSRLLILKAPTA
jgi:phosphoglucomutase